jgi:hypothetical protein
MPGKPCRTAVLITAIVFFLNGPTSCAQELTSKAGTGAFLLLSDLHFEPFGDPAVMKTLAGPNVGTGCTSASLDQFSSYGHDSNTLLLKSALATAADTATKNHLDIDYIVVTGDFLAHDFDVHYRQCVGGDKPAYTKFASDTLLLVQHWITDSFPAAPVFAALGNNDTDEGDYAQPSGGFLKAVGSYWRSDWGTTSPEAASNAAATFEKAGHYVVPHPTVAGRDLVVVNSNLWSSVNPNACSGSSPDPGGQFAWLREVLGNTQLANRTATLIMHSPPGIDVNSSLSHGQPETLWTSGCTEKFLATINEFPGAVREIYAGHIHRDDLRILRDGTGRIQSWIHILPSVSPVYGNNPALEIGWYDRKTGDLTDFAALSLNLKEPQPGWALEYIFGAAYGCPRVSLLAIEKLSSSLRAGNPSATPGRQYANYYAAGAESSLMAEDWPTYSCAQRELTIAAFTTCVETEIHHKK